LGFGFEIIFISEPFILAPFFGERPAGKYATVSDDEEEGISTEASE